jgi:hypothetical protein
MAVSRINQRVITAVCEFYHAEQNLCLLVYKRRCAMLLLLSSVKLVQSERHVMGRERESKMRDCLVVHHDFVPSDWTNMLGRLVRNGISLLAKYQHSRLRCELQPRMPLSK